MKVRHVAVSKLLKTRVERDGRKLNNYPVCIDNRAGQTTSARREFTLRKETLSMPDDTARKRLKQKVLERWENEGGKIIDLNSTRRRKEDHKSASQSSRSPENLKVGKYATPGNKRKPR